jgi:selenocysteine lyase/cysteine desulfurase
VHYYNSEEEVNAFAAAVAALLGRNGATPPE